MLPNGLCWDPHSFVGETSLWYLKRGSDELARVGLRADSCTWLSEVARHRRDYRRRMHVIAPTRETAMRWAERWTFAHLAKILTELPYPVPAGGYARMQWPDSNPDYDFGLKHAGPMRN